MSLVVCEATEVQEGWRPCPGLPSWEGSGNIWWVPPPTAFLPRQDYGLLLKVGAPSLPRLPCTRVAWLEGGCQSENWHWVMLPHESCLKLLGRPLIRPKSLSLSHLIPGPPRPTSGLWMGGEMGSREDLSAWHATACSSTHRTQQHSCKAGDFLYLRMNELLGPLRDLPALSHFSPDDETELAAGERCVWTLWFW